MAPLLIDSRDLLKLSFISVLVTILVFAGGFFMGHQQAVTFYQAGSETQSLSLPEPVLAVENIVDSQVPELIEAGEEVDVDLPETPIQANNVSKKPMPDSATASVAITEAEHIEQQAEHKQNSVVAGIQTSESQTPKSQIPISHRANPERDVNDSSRVVKEIANSEDALIVTTLSSDELSKIKYSIQVGVYRRLTNAENMVKTLQAKQYDAYVTDYTNKKNEIRYNVRLGYFKDRKSAIATLGEFNANQKGDGYLVKFSADKIFNLAGAADIEQAVDAPVLNDETDKVLTPVIVPSAIVQDKISQTGILNDMLVTAN